MPYNTTLADRIRRIAKGKNVTEKSMFGGLSFLINGKMFCGVIKNEIVVRVGPEAYEDALKMKGARPMDFTGRPVKGFVYVNSAGVKNDKDLAKWVDMGKSFAATLK